MSDKFNLVSVNAVDSFSYFPKKKLKILVVLLLAAAALFMYNSPTSFVVPDEIDSMELYMPNKTKNILFWTEFFQHHTWYSKQDGNVGKEELESVNCPVTNCYFTHEKGHLNNVTEFDAIMFHGPEFIPQLPQHANLDQLYIFVSLEAPTAVFGQIERFVDFYNMTMTYRMDSDVEWDYGKIVSAEKNEVIAPSKTPNWKSPEDNFFDQDYLNIYLNKTKSIAWFVSKCNAHSKRQNLVQKMKDLIDVDIYGKCGNLSCTGIVCDKLLTSTYKFYLSFENSLCTDYVTEKLYRALNEFTIPIVFNGLKDNTMYSPPKSFINANDFDTPEDLVNYLKFLMSNPREYIKYFWWKKHYIVKTHPVYPYTHCDLCKKLNDKSFMTQKHQYGDIKSWFFDGACNQTSHIKF